MLSKQSVLPNFIRAIAVLAIASLSFNASAEHHEKDMKKAKSEYMQKAGDKKHGDKMKDKLSEKYKGVESNLDGDALDLEEGEDAMEEAAKEELPE